MQYQVGDLVKLKAGPDKGKRAVVYEAYPDFDDSSKNGVSLITEAGQDLGGFSFQEQQDYLELVKHTSFIYDFKNVIQLYQDQQKRLFNHLFEQPQ